MASKSTYQDYISEYEKRDYNYDQFFEEIRDRDKVLLSLVDQEVSQDGQCDLLDICCSTGVLLSYLKERYKNINLSGIDLGAKLITEARKNPKLEGVELHVGDILDMSFNEQFDLITANNALMFFDLEEYAVAIGQIAKALKPGGTLLICDLYHEFDHDLKIEEHNSWFDGTYVSYHRSMSSVTKVLQDNGLVDIEYIPFYMTKDLEMQDEFSTATSYTLDTKDGRKLSMRGALLQPFCHVRVRKPA